MEGLIWVVFPQCKWSLLALTVLRTVRPVAIPNQRVWLPRQNQPDTPGKGGQAATIYCCDRSSQCSNLLKHIAVLLETQLKCWKTTLASTWQLPRRMSEPWVLWLRTKYIVWQLSNFYFCRVQDTYTYSIQWCALAKSLMSTLQTSTAPLILDSDTIFFTYMEIFVCSTRSLIEF